MHSMRKQLSSDLKRSLKYQETEMMQHRHDDRKGLKFTIQFK